MKIYEDFIDDIDNAEIISDKLTSEGKKIADDFYFHLLLPPDEKVSKQMKFLLEKTPAVSDYELFTKEEYNDGTHKTFSDNVIAFDAEFKTPSGSLLFLKNILYAFFGKWSD